MCVYIYIIHARRTVKNELAALALLVNLSISACFRIRSPVMYIHIYIGV